jgi:protein-S-isoprenylcysteine O-methyltransferase Ste14
VKQEQVFNTLAGLSILSWSMLGILATGETAHLSSVRISISLLHLMVGYLFLLRDPLVKSCGAWDIIMTIPSLLIGGFAFIIAPPPHEWPLIAELTFITGTCLVIISIIYLGKYFAIFPAFRGLVVRGPYSIVRHPIYVGEFMMIFACFLASTTFLSFGLLLAILPSIIIRINSEEYILNNAPNHENYTINVTWRLLPGIW